MKNFKRENFFPLKKKYMIEDLNKLIEPETNIFKLKKNFFVNDISSLSTLRDCSIIFLESELNNINISSKDIHVVTDKQENIKYYDSISIVKNINKAYNCILNALFYHEDQSGFPDEYEYVNGSYISKFCKINNNVEIGKNCLISRGVEIDENTIIKNNVVIKNSLLGKNVIICDNSSIGTTGFGFDFNLRGSLHLNPQIGVVIIEDNVHIGASCAVDRGKIDSTLICKNSMIDNMVHIAHNVTVGENCCIAAQTGISGSVKIGKNVTIGGQAGFAGHIKIGNNTVIAARSGVTKDIKENSVVAGFPAVDIKEWKKNLIRQRKNGY